MWGKEDLISKDIIVNGFIKAGISGNFYLSKDEEKSREGFIYDLGLNNDKDILDDISQEMDINQEKSEISESDEIDLENGVFDEKKSGNNGNDNKDNLKDDIDFKNEIKSLENNFIMNCYNYSPMDLDD